MRGTKKNNEVKSQLVKRPTLSQYKHLGAGSSDKYVFAVFFMVLWLGYFFPLILFWFDLECKITVARVHYDIAESCMIPCQVFFLFIPRIWKVRGEKTCIVEGGKKIPHKDVFYITRKQMSSSTEKCTC